MSDEKRDRDPLDDPPAAYIESEQLPDGTVKTTVHEARCPVTLRAWEEAKRQRGPAKVNSAAFRSGWDVTFGGKKATVGQA